jgi:hypothetical protein
METAVACKKCGFQFKADQHLGQLSSVRLDQRQMKARCKRAAEPEFAYDCADLTSSLLASLEMEASLQHQKRRSALRRALATSFAGALESPAQR